MLLSCCAGAGGAARASSLDEEGALRAAQVRSRRGTNCVTNCAKNMAQGHRWYCHKA